MARLDFDFHQRPARPGKLGIALALAGAAALLWAWNNLQAVRATGAGLSTRIAALEQARPRTAARPSTGKGDPAKIQQARIAAQLAYSWQPALDALAAARTRKIALLSLDAVQARSQLKLTAEARTLADALAYIDVLQQQPGVKRATLSQHEVQADADQHPVRFNILLELDT